MKAQCQDYALNSIRWLTGQSDVSSHSDESENPRATLNPFFVPYASSESSTSSRSGQVSKPASPVISSPARSVTPSTLPTRPPSIRAPAPGVPQGRPNMRRKTPSQLNTREDSDPTPQSKRRKRNQDEKIPEPSSVRTDSESFKIRNLSKGGLKNEASSCCLNAVTFSVHRTGISSHLVDISSIIN